jgi:hypothetical protein
MVGWIVLALLIVWAGWYIPAIFEFIGDLLVMLILCSDD